VHEMRAADLDDLGAQTRQQVDSLGEALLHPRRISFTTELADDADAQALDIGLAGRGRHARQRRIDRGGIRRVVAAHDLVQQRRVEHGTSARSGLVERRGHRDHAVAGDAAIGGLDADRSGDRGRLADRTAGIGADRQRSLEGRQARRRTAARATRDPLQIPRIAGRTVGGGLGRGTHRELVQIRLAEDHQAGGKQPVDDRGVVRRNPALQNARAGRRGQPLIAEEVFDPDRHSCQGAQLLAGRDPGVHRACLLQGALGIDGQEGVNVGVHLFDAIKTLAGDLFGALFPGGDPAAEFGCGLGDRGRHHCSRSKMRGTRN